ncbi:hypothetical protein M404DRAFT_33043 [Pisolithus tinctorius Marx 270]|uniref:Uncharacterized protein n=1 Tax=Pisolithus tinctorius Marx 270 TaxID=870435 RepID=A0A0C3JGF5_PISTI|nr:hypothetical protein M404DRAFT_33043 [Pisolithus tinctorius Marx 270]
MVLIIHLFTVLISGQGPDPHVVVTFERVMAHQLHTRTEELLSMPTDDIKIGCGHPVDWEFKAQGHVVIEHLKRCIVLPDTHESIHISAFQDLETIFSESSLDSIFEGPAHRMGSPASGPFTVP